MTHDYTENSGKDQFSQLPLKVRETLHRATRPIGKSFWEKINESVKPSHEGKNTKVPSNQRALDSFMKSAFRTKQQGFIPAISPLTHLFGKKMHFIQEKFSFYLRFVTQYQRLEKNLME